jgi:hypothetical protein
MFMNRRTAKEIHAATNLSYWMENPDWQSGSAAFDVLCKALQKLPFSVHEAQKKIFFNSDNLLAVNGETVVVANGTDKVDKCMFRYPTGMSTEQFCNQVDDEISVVTGFLASVALATAVDLKPARIFRRPMGQVRVVTQTQRRLDLDIYEALDIDKIASEDSLPQLDTTMKDLDGMLLGTQALVETYGYYPDIAHNSGNLRRNVLDGSVTLIDVMPIYSNGNRLIDDNPPGLLEHTVDTIARYEEIVGRYGA